MRAFKYTILPKLKVKFEVETDCLIIGGGLSGLALANHLQELGLNYQLFEARERMGGRVLSLPVTHNGKQAFFDMGPAWFWPGQPRIANMVELCGLERFYQYSKGELIYEDEGGNVQKGIGYSSMKGSYRLRGGLASLIAAVQDRLDPERLHTEHRAVNVTKTDGLSLDYIDPVGAKKSVLAKKVILALPPRVAQTKIKFSPALDENIQRSMCDIPTWMAGHAKIVFVYETAFWREQGLSGDVMSRRGPMVEIHDASAFEDGPFALFGFVGTPINVRKNRRIEIIEAARVQLKRLFGPQSDQPIDIFYKDWVDDPATATHQDHQPLTHHPTYGLPNALQNVWDGRIIFGSTEVASRFGGYLEGALEAAEHVVQRLLSDK